MLQWPEAMTIEICRTRHVFLAFVLLIKSNNASTEVPQEQNITDEYGLIKSPSSNETGIFKYNIFPFMDTTILIKSLGVYLSERKTFEGCAGSSNFVTVTQIPKREESSLFCGNDTIVLSSSREQIVVYFKKQSTNRSFFEISYKSCSEVFSGSNGTITTAGEFQSSDTKPRRCYFLINVTSSMMISFLGSNEQDCKEVITISDSTEMNSICNNGMQTLMTKTGPVEIRYNGTGVTRIHAEYTAIPKDYLHTKLKGREGKFGPRLFNNEYANNANYTFTIATDNGGHVLVYFQSINFETECKDVLRYNENIMCDHNASSIIMADEEVTVSFITDATGSGSGFDGFWTTCGGKYGNNYGVLKQPDLNGQSLSEEIRCTYDVEIQNTENIYLKIENTSNNVINISGRGISSGVHRGNQLVFEYKAKPMGLEPFELYYMGCPRIFESEAGNVTLQSPWNSLVPVGFNCSFIIRNSGNKTMILSIDITHEDNSASTTNSSELVDTLKIVRNKENNQTVTESITLDGDHIFKSYGESVITYISGSGTKLNFKAFYKLQSENEEDDKHEDNNGEEDHVSKSEETNNDVTSSVIIPISIVIAVVIVSIIGIALYCYRRKKTSTADSLKRSSAENQAYFNDENLGGKSNEANLAVAYAEIRIDKHGGKSTVMVVKEERSESGLNINNTVNSEVEQSQPNNQVNPAQRCEYATPWDAKNERDKITKVLEGNCPDEADTCPDVAGTCPDVTATYLDVTGTCPDVTTNSLATVAERADESL